jgi:hypothetical protein
LNIFFRFQHGRFHTLTFRKRIGLLQFTLPAVPG